MKKLFFLFILFCFNANAQIINIPDANFKAKLIQQGVDTNSDGQIQQSEALAITTLYADNSNISSLIGIQSFTNLVYLNCSGDSFTTLDVSGLVHLTSLQSTYCNNLTTLNASGCISLQGLALNDGYQLNTLNISGCNLLNTVYLQRNQLTTLNFNGCNNLQTLQCDYNNLTSLYLNGCSSLQVLDIDFNNLTSIDLSSNFSLTNINIGNNMLTTLNVSNCHNLVTLQARNNLLIDIFEKTGSGPILNVSGNSNLQYICTDEWDISWAQLASYHANNTCQVNSYCSFTPGGTFYTIQGDSRFDIDNNGYDVLNPLFPYLKFNITDGTTSGSLISDASGNYSIPVQAGTHTITPVFENSSYFNASPVNVVVNFPTQASPFTQNFCITANGIHPDLEVVLMPLNRARPGFDATYELIYKNKGNTMQSGTISLNFNDAILDLVTATPIITNQTPNNLSWDFTNLAPFETREILVTLNINSPTETPAVNSGDILNYTATITSVATDETPNDNIFSFNQTVANSYDPNDKVCLEGTTITPEKVGDYVHYMIHFENTGTFPAQNIVVKDMIDAAKFDVNSIIPIKGSHPFVTKISSGNNVEFIFENINLPFDDANNDGYVAFKIKTKPTLVNGDTFSNTANIYFDYNFPIVTNTATTTIAALTVQDFEFAHYFNIYPNPVHDILNISTKESIQVSSVSVYNMLGQLVLLVPSAQNVKMVDVSNLTSGNYFIKINSDKGTSNTKFVKN